MSHWKGNLDTKKNTVNTNNTTVEFKKSTGDGVAMRTRRIFCAFFVIVGCIFMADALYDLSFIRESTKENTETETRIENTINAELLFGDQSVNADGTDVVSADFDDMNLYKPDFEALKLQNPDIVAWIKIPGMSIDEPVVQTTDNEYYLKIGFDGEKNSAGTVFLDYESSSDASDFHSIFYGHHMKNGSRFSELVRLKDEDFFKEHRTAYLYLSNGNNIRLRIIAALTADSGSEHRKTDFSDEGELYSYIENMTKECAFRELPDSAVSHLYSFVTCSYEFPDARTIVYAVEEGAV